MAGFSALGDVEYYSCGFAPVLSNLNSSGKRFPHDSWSTWGTADEAEVMIWGDFKQILYKKFCKWKVL